MPGLDWVLDSSREKGGTVEVEVGYQVPVSVRVDLHSQLVTKVRILDEFIGMPRGVVGVEDEPVDTATRAAAVLIAENVTLARVDDWRTMGGLVTERRHAVTLGALPRFSRP